jgi:histidine triad (HIT) family protein
MLDDMSSSDCLFCKIAAGAIPSKKVFEDERAFAIVDIRPQAPVHVLVIPKKHVASLAETGANDKELLAHLLEVARELAVERNLGQGYRVVINTGPNGGQTVDHLHLHLIGGRAMHWPPG